MKHLIYFLAINLFLITNVLNAQAQWNTTLGNNVTSLATYLGTNSSSTSPLQIKTVEIGSSALPIGFWTNNTPHMTLRTDGNLNIVNGSNGYWINNDPILWHNGNNTRVYVGVGAGNANSVGTNNTFVGNNAGLAILDASNNTFVGTSSGRFNSSGFENSCFGALAGNTITTGAHQTMLGSSANPSASNLDYATAVGAFSTVSQSNSLVLGAIEGLNSAPSSTSVGIGTPAPNAVLHLNRNTNTAVYTRYTNPNAPATFTAGGLEVGLDASGIGIIRHYADYPIEIWTKGFINTRRNSSFTSNLTFGNIGTLNTQGDGLRIHDPNNSGGDLDLWTSGSNQSHIVWGPNGRIQGVNNRLEIQADFVNGLWLNVANPNTGTFFNALGAETGRIGANTFWRIGANTSNLNGNRRLEVVDNANPQFRLTHTANATPTLGIWSDFQTTSAGNLFINPRNGSTGGNVGVNIAPPPLDCT